MPWQGAPVFAVEGNALFATLIVGVGDIEKVKETKAKVKELRASGELDRIIKNMRLENEN